MEQHATAIMLASILPESPPFLRKQLVIYALNEMGIKLNIDDIGKFNEHFGYEINKAQMIDALTEIQKCVEFNQLDTATIKINTTLDNLKFKET